MPALGGGAWSRGGACSGGGGAWSQGGGLVPGGAGGDPPPDGYLLRAVRILLECIFILHW